MFLSLQEAGGRRAVLLSQGLVVGHHDVPGFGSHEPLGRCGSLARHLAHLCARDEEEVVLVFGAEEVHGFLLQVVGCHAERDDLQLGKTWRHRQNLRGTTEGGKKPEV